ncbi:hypothetical protein, partial [Pseudoalteromonas piscicida]
EVKQNSVDDSVDYPCESRTSPGPNKRNPLQQCDGFFAVWGIENLASQLKPREVNSLLPQYQHSATWCEVVYPPMVCNEVLKKYSKPK